MTIYDESISLAEVADRIYRVAMHPVKYQGEYIAGEAKDADRHKPKR
ncbi:MAG: hypothetical protein HY675_13480 [Chloroflexi bacterium]|nr:hypothetical protein [Chloroflexota bacterium]